MTLRLFMDSTGLRISQPGVNAQTATNVGNNFIFDSRNRAYFGIFLSGAVSISSFSSGIFDVMYGKTFLVPPPVIIVFEFAGGTGLATGVAYPQCKTGLSTGSLSYMWGTSMVDRLRFFIVQGIVSGVAPVPASVSYIVGES